MRATLPVCSWFALALAALPLPAQDRAVPARPDPTRPLLRIGCDGPAAFRQAFLATNVGGLLGADEATPLLLPVQEVLLQAFGAQRATLWPLLRDYRGRIELQAFTAPGPGREVHLAAVLRLSGDGRTDLDAVAAGLTARLRALASGEHDELKIAIAGAERPALRRDGEILVLPFGDGEGIAVAYAMGPPELLAERTAAACAAPLHRAPTDAPLELHLDLQQVAEVSMHADGSDEEDRAIAEAIWGIAAMRSLTLRAAPAGPQVMVELQAAFDPAPGGLFRGFLPDVQEPPSMTHLVPPACPAWKDGHIRPDQVVDSFLEALAAIFEDGDRKTFDERMVQELGYHLVDDLLVHLGDEALWLGGPWLAPPDEGDRRSGSGMPLEGTLLVFEIRDQAAFLRTWPRARQGLLASLAITPEKIEHAGATIEGGGSFLLESELWLCVTDGLGLMAFGEPGLQLLQQVLDRREEPPGTLPAVVERVRRQAPPGWNGAAHADLRAVFGGQLGFVKDVLAEMLTGTGLDLQPEGVVADFAPYARLLAKHELDQVVTLTGYRDGTWTFRLLW